MSAQKAAYPSRPPKQRSKKPSKGANKKPSSEHINPGPRGSKTWLSDGSIVNGKEVRSNRRISTKRLYVSV